MTPCLYVGKIAHRRHIPESHEFAYPFFMWFLDLDALEKGPDLIPWVSTRRRALYRFHRPDYLGSPDEPLSEAVRRRMLELTRKPVTGQVYGLMTLRSPGLYFSPVNFYFGFDRNGRFTHFLAEVSNIPWNERHQYGHYVAGGRLCPSHPKAFHVSPFNPLAQSYAWRIRPPGDTVRIGIDVRDPRGHVFEARLDLARRPLTLSGVRGAIFKKPVMTAFILAGIYWQALRLFLKGVPYVPYEKEAP